MDLSEALKRVDEDDASIILRDTICGVGLRSNKTIRRFRRAVKHVTETTKTQARFREIEVLLEDEYSFIPREVFQDLLEYQRVELYPDGVKQRALELLLQIMQQKRPTYYFAEELSALPSAEGQLFLRELYLFQQCGWPSNVTRLESGRKSLDRTPRVVNLTEWAESLSHTFRELLRELLKIQPNLLHDVFDIFQILAVFLGHSSVSHRDDKHLLYDTDSLSPLFQYMKSDYHKARLNEWKLYPLARAVFDFAITGSPDLHRSVIQLTLRSLREQLADLSKSSDNKGVFSGNATTELFLSDRPNLRDAGLHSPKSASSHRRCSSRDSSSTPSSDSATDVAPSLWFASHLILHSQDAFNTFMESGGLDILKQLWTITNGPTQAGASSDIPSAMQDCRWLCCLILGIISVKNPFQSFFDQLHSDDQQWFYAIFRVFNSHYETIEAFRSQVRSQGSLDDHQAVYNLLLYDLSQEGDIASEDMRWDVMFMELHDRREKLVVNAIRRLDSIAVSRRVLQRAVSTARFSSATSLPRAMRLASLVWLINELAQQQPQSIDGIVDVKLAAFLYGSLKEVPGSSDEALSLLFARQRLGHRQASQFIGYGGHELSQKLVYFIDYLVVAPSEDLEAVVRYIADSLVSAPNSVPGENAESDSEPDQITRWKEDNLISCLQLLEFAAFLAVQVPSSAQLFLEANIVHITLELCTSSATFFPSIQVDGFRGTEVMAKDIIQIQSLLLLSSIASSKMDGVVDKVKADEHWEYYPNLFIEAAIKTQLSSLSSTGTLAPLQALIANTLDAFPLYFLGITDETDTSLPNMIKSLSLFGSDLAYSGKMNVSREIIKFITLSPRQSWGTVFTQAVITHPSLHHCIAFIIKEFLGCKSDVELALGDEDRMFLIRLWHRAADYGLHETHPIDRFILLIYYIGTRLQWFTTWYSRLLEIGIITLSSRMVSGDYDFEDMVDRGSLWRGNMSRSQIVVLRKRRHDFFEEKCRYNPGAVDRQHETRTLFPPTETQVVKEKPKPRLILHSEPLDNTDNL